VRNVGGDRVTAVSILGPEADPHDYQPIAEDARKFAAADVVFYNGIGLEGQWGPALLKNTKQGAIVVELPKAAGIKVEEGDEEEPEGDPHVWQDPTNVRKMVGVIRDTLAKADAADTAIFQANAAAYDRQLDELDREIEGQIKTIPPAQRKLVTNHDAFGYYVKRYGLTFVGSVIPSLSSEAEPSAGEVQKLVAAIKAEGVKAIYTETNLNPRLEKQIAEQAGVKVFSDLYGDALGPPGSDGDTYIKAMRHNTKAIVEGLKG
jgi:zinc/manganese transport system substrate-binding protein/manganese/iron transport system substrate-binding protein